MAKRSTFDKQEIKCSRRKVIANLNCEILLPVIGIVHLRDREQIRIKYKDNEHATRFAYRYSESETAHDLRAIWNNARERAGFVSGLRIPGCIESKPSQQQERSRLSLLSERRE